jgi:hypothetical protein
MKSTIGFVALFCVNPSMTFASNCNWVFIRDNNLCELMSNYDESRAGAPAGNTGQSYVRPTCSGNAIPNDIKVLLGDAFNASSAKLKGHLCGLNKIFVNNSPAQTRKGSWGIWEADDQVYAEGQKKYVAIDGDALRDILNTPSGSLRRVENSKIAATLPRGRASWNENARPSFISFDSSASEASAAIVSILAHEIGHVLWHEFVKQGTNCYTAELTATWQPGWTNERWKRLAARDSASLRNGVPHPESVDDDAEQANGKRRAAGKAKRMVETKQFSSILGAASPEEDFVETYKTVVLSRSGLGSLVLSVPDQNDTGTPTGAQLIQLDVISATADATSALSRRARCIADLGFESP